MSVRLDYLPKHEDIKIYQDDTMFCINTDTMALGEFLEVYRFDTILDIGTNTGALMLYASLFKPHKIIGLEINEKALVLAKKNMKINNISNYELINADALTYKGEEVDVIVCNPPYFKTKDDEKGKNEYKALAKHEGEMNLNNLMQTIRRNLKNHGTLFMLYQTSRLSEVIAELKTNKMTVKKLKFVYDSNDSKEYSNVVLIKARKGVKDGLVVEKPLFIERK